MKYIEKNISKIILIFLFMQPIVDVITALSIHYFDVSITIGMIVRFLFLIFCLCYIFFISKNKYKKKLFIYFLILLIYCLCYIGNLYINEDMSTILVNVSSLFKVVYIPIVLIFFYIIYKDKVFKFDSKYFGILYYIYLLFVFVPSILGVGLKTYEVTKEGSIGFFYSANEIGGIISILMPFFLVYVLSLKNTIIKWSSIILFFYILFFMGTKGPLISFGIICVYYFIKLFREFILKKDYKNIGAITGLVLIIIVSLCLILPKTTFYDNLKVHLEFLKIDSVDDLANIKKIDHLVFSERFSFWEDTNKIYLKEDVPTKLLGMGYVNKNKLEKTVEMDYVDIFYHQGLFGFIIILGPYFVLCFNIIKKYFKTKNKSKYNILFLSFILSLLLSMFTGHIIVSTNVYIFIALIMNMFYNEINRVVK